MSRNLNFHTLRWFAIATLENNWKLLKNRHRTLRMVTKRVQVDVHARPVQECSQWLCRQQPRPESTPNVHPAAGQGTDTGLCGHATGLSSQRSGVHPREHTGDSRGHCAVGRERQACRPLLNPHTCLENANETVETESGCLKAEGQANHHGPEEPRRLVVPMTFQG